MVAKLSVGTVFTGRIVAELRGNATITGLLFSTRASTQTLDLRVYDDQVTFLGPLEPLREVLPRILVANITSPFDTENANADSTDLYENVVVFIHVLVEQQEKMLGETIAAEVRDILVSTSLSNATIIASVLVPGGSMQPTRETAFKNAWRFSNEYRAQAGVL